MTTNTFRVGDALGVIACGHALDLGPAGVAVCGAEPVIGMVVIADRDNPDDVGRLLCACAKHRAALAKWAVSGSGANAPDVEQQSNGLG